MFSKTIFKLNVIIYLFLKKIIFQGSVFVIGLGTIANTIAVIIGGGIGLFLKKGIKKSLQDSLLQAMGIAVLFIGIGGTLSQMFVFKDGHLETTGTMLMIFSLLIGTLIGEIINSNLYWRYGYYWSTPRWFIW
ncbi:MAG: DUF554 family protein [Megamonas funiformis]|nr:DUF554 family protein [Megamonas funiformis]